MTDIIRYLQKKGAEKKNIGHGGGGDACCGGGEPETPDVVVLNFVMKLAETLVEILGEAPFNGSPTLKTQEGQTFKYKGEVILTTLQAFVLKVIGGGLEENRKITVDAQGSGNGAISVDVYATKIPGIIDEPHALRRRTFIALVDLANNSTQV